MRTEEGLEAGASLTEARLDVSHDSGQSSGGCGLQCACQKMGEALARATSSVEAMYILACIVL